MDSEALKCDLFHALQNHDHSVMPKWKASCQEFRSHIAVKFKERLLRQKDRTEKKSANDRKVSELQQESDTVGSNIDAVALQWKVTDKKISNAIKSQESVKDEMEKLKAQEDTLSLEMVDVELERETKRRNKVLKWDAIKRACQIYKHNLDIHISLQEEEDRQEVKFSFFTQSAVTKDKYFVQLSCSDNHWKVEQIEPNVRREHFNQLSITTDPSDRSKVPDLTLFLCQIRNIFLKHYMKTGKKQ
ncbi:hypothetical protein DMN91_010558 [Ooceraea biroi]|uniref:Kinetochore protein SPC25 n=1 Tax=Ooceraea biroi TaxID=2015173 RepID=A0A026WW99_OOCBI|nr:uncharacterized protein LOC105274491 [Ooceraea biroi]EZA60345.1 hypothetical protein X777_13434 [Ooceraea biroi]RLU16490.1 hypothetical protein DMN91_010558 [Ooceraea biroi]